MIWNEDEARAFVAARCDAAAMARLETLTAMLARLWPDLAAM